MATLEQALNALLRDDPVLTSLIAKRVYPDALPQGVVYPSISYFRVSTARSQWRRLGDGLPSMIRPRFQIDCWATTPMTAKAIGDAVVSLLDGFRGAAGPGSPQIAIDAAAVEDEASAIEPEIHVGGAHIYGRRIDVFLAHLQP